LRLLNDERRAELAEAIHAASRHLTETQLRHLELFIALRRWRRRNCVVCGRVNVGRQATRKARP